MDPIEEAFSKVKDILRRKYRRAPKRLLWKRWDRLWTRFTPEEIRGFYNDCGYRLPLQSF